MAFDYNTLVGAKSVEGSIKFWAGQVNIPSVSILEQAEDHIYSLIRTQEMTASVSFTVAAGDATAPLPTDFLDPIKMTDRYRNKIKHKTPASLEDLMSVETDTLALTTAYPKYWAAYNELINFNCKGQEALPYRLLYYKKPAPLSSSNLTNFLTRRYKHLVLAACLMYVAVFNEDDGAYAREGARALQAVKDIGQADDLGLRDVEVNAENY